MKIEQLLVQYLYNTKKVSLQDMGTFTIADADVVPTEGDKETTTTGTITFEFNSKEKIDEGLVDFIVQQTRKIRPLASSDLESYSILSKQFLNIGKPMIIEGLGVLQKNQQDTYDFKQGNMVNTKLDAVPSQMKEKLSEEISFRSPEKQSADTPKKTWLMLGLLLFVMLIAAVLFYFIYYKPKETTTIAEVTPVVADTIKTAPTVTIVAPDTTKIITADTTAKMITPAADGATFSVVIKEYANKAAAEKAFARLTRYGHKLVLLPIDSVRYKIAMPFTSDLSDTLRAKDSLRKFFQSNTYINHP